MTRCYGIALGSNLGDREKHLHTACSLLLQRAQPVAVRVASLYETAPVDCGPESQPFFNSVVEIETALSPTELHTITKGIEKELGRPDQRAKNAPRTADLDLLYAGDWLSSDAELTLPHPRLHLRRFVLQPLAEIRPDLILPGHDKTIARHLADLPYLPGELNLIKKHWHS